MKIIQKDPNKDFIILNVSDPQLSNEEWGKNHPHPKILTDTLTALIHRVQPDLITVSGDLAWGGNVLSCTRLAELIDQFGIPWAPIWGMNDNLGGSDYIDSMGDILQSLQHCLYEKGPKTLGAGNYVIGIEEKGKIVEGLILMDSHGTEYYQNEAGETFTLCAKLWPQQLSWYHEQVKMLESKGCSDTTLIHHIPIFAYHSAFLEAFRHDCNPLDVSLEESYSGACWNDGYKDSFGVCHQSIASYHNSYGNCAEPMRRHPDDDDMFALIKECGSTKTVLAGQDHTNNFVISYEGVTLAYSLKLGAGSYWEPLLNGGTILRVSSRGVEEVRHEYVKIEFHYEIL